MNDASNDYGQALSKLIRKTANDVMFALIAYVVVVVFPVGMALWSTDIGSYLMVSCLSSAWTICVFAGIGFTSKAVNDYMEYQCLQTDRLIAAQTANQQVEVPKRVEV